jgi:hypothetical protein
MIDIYGRTPVYYAVCYEFTKWFERGRKNVLGDYLLLTHVEAGINQFIRENRVIIDETAQEMSKG